MEKSLFQLSSAEPPVHKTEKLSKIEANRNRAAGKKSPTN